MFWAPAKITPLLETGTGWEREVKDAWQTSTCCLDSSCIVSAEQRYIEEGLNGGFEHLDTSLPNLGEIMVTFPNFLDFSASLIVDEVPAVMHDLRSDFRRQHWAAKAVCLYKSYSDCLKRQMNPAPDSPRCYLSSYYWMTRDSLLNYPWVKPPLESGLRISAGVAMLKQLHRDKWKDHLWRRKPACSI